MLSSKSLRYRSTTSFILRTASACALIVAASLGAGQAEGADKAPHGRSSELSAFDAERASWRLAPESPRPGCVTVPSLDPAEVSCATVTSVFPTSPAGYGANPTRTRVTIPWSTVVQRPNVRPEPERAPIENGFDPAPRWQVEVDRELFLMIADLTNTTLAMRSYGEDVEEMRAWRNMRDDERTRKRGTYFEVEEFMGHSDDDKVDPMVFAGMSLTALTGFLAAKDWDEVVINETLDLKVRPKLWPPGLRIKGTFPWP